MKYPINNYTQAFNEVMKELPDQQDYITKKFIKLLEKTGDIKYSNKILTAIHRKLINQNGGNWVNIETAREISAQKSDSLKAKFSVKDHIDFKINSVLVAGTRITINEQEELDNSLNTKLKKLFK